MKYSLLDFLTATVRVVRERGYISRSQARGTPLTPTSEYVQLRYDELLVGVALQDEVFAAKVWAWMGQLRSKHTDDFFARARHVWEVGYVEAHTANVAASAVSMYQRSLEKARVIALAPTKHVGTVGQPIACDATVTDLKMVRGGRNLIVFQDDAGNQLTYFTPSEHLPALNTRWALTAVVKRHGVFGNVPHTELMDLQIRGVAA